MADKKYSPNNTAQFLISNFGIIFLAIVFLVGGFFIGTLWTENKIMKSSETSVQQEKQAEKPTDTLEKKANNLDKMPEITENDHIQGAENPKIYLVEYSSYECSWCSKFYTTMKQIMEKYGDQIAWVYRHYSPNSIISESAECVTKLAGHEAFWNFTDVIYKKNNEPDSNLNQKTIDEAIKISGVDLGAVKNCLENGEVKNIIASQLNGGAAAGISGTPGTILMTVDGEYELITGALPLIQVEQIIEKYL